MLFKSCSDIDAWSNMQWGVNVTAQRLVKGDSDCATCCCINLCSPWAACPASLAQNLFPVSSLFCFLPLLFVCKFTFHIKSIAAAPRPLMRHHAEHLPINSWYLPKWYSLRYFCSRLPPQPPHTDHQGHMWVMKRFNVLIIMPKKDTAAGNIKTVSRGTHDCLENQHYWRRRKAVLLFFKCDSFYLLKTVARV